MSEIILYSKDGRFTSEQLKVINHYVTGANITADHQSLRDNELIPAFAAYEKFRDYREHAYSELKHYVSWESETSYFKDEIGEIEDSYCIIELPFKPCDHPGMLKWLWERAHTNKSCRGTSMVREYLVSKYFDDISHGYEEKQVSTLSVIFDKSIWLLQNASRFLSRCPEWKEPKVVVTGELLMIYGAQWFDEAMKRRKDLRKSTSS